MSGIIQSAGTVCRAAGSVLSALADVLFPRSCAGCGAGMERSPGHVCWDCLAGLEWIREPFCAWCGDPLAAERPAPALCAGCARRMPAFDRARSAVRFRGVSRDLVHAFKYRGATWLAPDLVALLRACYGLYFARAALDLVTYVPLHAARERDRSYNQARLLAEGLAGECPGLAVAGTLVRMRPAPSQTRLTAALRRANVHGIFAVENPAAVRGRRILLVDDVMTTGATVDECARMLKRAGAALVGVLTVGRG